MFRLAICLPWFRSKRSNSNSSLQFQHKILHRSNP
uniref:Uncharacterized protein n=1 Tax=Arundo donax TaxID=35708 RepID=A0A0A9F2X1_ARUDO